MAGQEIPYSVMFDIAIALQNELVLTCPRDRGRLWTTIRVVPYGKGLMISMAGYGKFVEFGSPPHIIKAKSGKVLHWHKTKGRGGHEQPNSEAMKKDAFFAKEVKHPGTRPNPFVRTAINTKLRKIIAENLRRASR